MFHRTTGPRLTRGYSAIVITENGFVKAHGKEKKVVSISAVKNNGKRAFLLVIFSVYITTYKSFAEGKEKFFLPLLSASRCSISYTLKGRRGRRSKSVYSFHIREVKEDERKL
jgi:hypothetical protein